MPPDVLRQGLHRDVHPVREGIEVHAGRPRVVERHDRVVRMRGSDDRGHILDLHRVRAGALAPHQPRVRSDALFDVAHRPAAGSTTPRRRGAGGARRRGCGWARRCFPAAGRGLRSRARRDRERERGLAAGHDERAVAVLELAHAGRELTGGRRAVLAVGVGEVVLVPRVASRRGIAEDRRGAPVDRHDEGPEAPGRERVGLHES